MQNLKATTSEVVHLKTLWAVHYKPLQEVHSIRYSQTNESSGCIFCVNDVEQACFDEFHQWHPARLSSGIVTIHYFQKCFIRCRELAYIQFYKARNAGFILIVTCAGLFCTDAFVKTDNRNQYSSCSGA